MSEETSANANIIDKVIVSEVVKENGTNSEKSSDSGIETTEACSEALPASSDSETSPVKSFSNYEIELSANSDNVDIVSKKEQGDGLDRSSTSSPLTSSNEDAVISVSPSSEGSPLKIYTENLPITKDQTCTSHEQGQDVYQHDLPTMILSNPSDDRNDKVNVLTALSIHLDSPNPSKSDSASNLTASTVSLEEKNISLKQSKSHSRSAENIPHLNIIQSKTISDVNKEEILSQFSTQKKQVNATQRIPELPPAIDVRSRLPKEITPDIGSIVKNVHGMFSSVSGSLKYYTNRNVQKPIKNLKPISNSKVMTDIFEDEINMQNDKVEEETSTQIVTQPDPDDDNQDLDLKSEDIRSQIEILEQLLLEQKKENTSLKEKIKQQVDEMHEKEHSYKDLEGKFELMSKRMEQADREKDAAVMRYASVECAAIEAKRAADAASKAERAARAELDLMNGKLKSAHGEKQRIIQLYDDKCHELQNCDRELYKVKEDIKELEGRLKWTQSKLRMEMDAYKDSCERAEKLSQQVAELEASKDAAAANATDSAKARQLETELKESRAALILCRHEKEDLDRRLTTTSNKLDACQKERDTASSSLTRTTAEVEQLKISNLRLEEEAAELAALRAKAALADALGTQLERETQRANQMEEALTLARAQSETCVRREAAALEHAARLTAKHVSQRASTDSRLAKAQALSADNECLRERVTSLEGECSTLQAALTEETDRRNQENRVLARKVAELTEESAEAIKKLEWEKGENGVLKKKHNTAIKELNRELQRTLKRCEQLEAKLPPPDAPSTRTGSITSLSSGESVPQDDRLQNGHEVPEIQVREPDKQALIERIVSLQRAAARRSERCEFLEEHSKQLTEELRNKSRLLRQLLCTMPAGAVTSPHRDINKKQIASAGGGAMAAVWGGEPDGLSRELSLEMNKRLQAVLEDTLLKNITLKENMDTLGAEISRLKLQKPDST